MFHRANKNDPVFEKPVPITNDKTAWNSYIQSYLRGALHRKLGGSPWYNGIHGRQDVSVLSLESSSGLPWASNSLESPPWFDLMMGHIEYSCSCSMKSVFYLLANNSCACDAQFPIFCNGEGKNGRDKFQLATMDWSHFSWWNMTLRMKDHHLWTAILAQATLCAACNSSRNMWDRGSGGDNSKQSGKDVHHRWRQGHIVDGKHEYIDEVSR